MNILLILPILIPFVTGIVMILFWGNRPAHRTLGVISTGALLFVGLALLADVWQNGIQVVQISNWPAPYGITLVADLLSAIMVVLAGLMGFAVAIYSLTAMDPQREIFGYYPLLQILLMGICGAFLTGDLFNLYVWFEVMLIASFVLLVLGGERAQLEGGIKYVTLNLISSAIFLAAVGAIYGLLGTVNMADLAVQIQQTPYVGIVQTLAMMFLVAYGIKAAIFPLFFWLPSSYHTPPVAISAIFSGLLTKVGVYTLIRVFTLLFVTDVGYTHNLIVFLAGMTMLTGVLGAATQNEFRRILSFHIISQIGYMIMGLGLFTVLGLTGSVFYIMHHIIVKTNLFLVSGVVYQLKGTYQLKKLGGLYQYYPILGVLFLIPAFSLAGVPPLSGFWAKYTLIRAGLEEDRYLIVAVALFVGLLTLFSMTKIWAQVFWKADPNPDPDEDHTPPSKRWPYLIIPIASLALITLAIGLFSEPLFILAQTTAEQLLNPSEYINAVLYPAGGPS